MKRTFLLVAAVQLLGLFAASDLQGQDNASRSFVPEGKSWKKGDVLRTSANVEGVRFSADGRLLLMAAHQGVSVWDWKKERELQYVAFPKGTRLSAMQISADGKRLATAHLDSTRVLIWDLAKGVTLKQLNHGAPVNALAFSPDGKHLASGGGHSEAEKAGRDSYVQLWSVADGKEVKRFLGPNQPVRTVALSAESLVAEEAKGEVFVWSRVSGEFERQIATHAFLNPVEMLGEGRTLVGYEVGAGRFLTRWDTALDKKEQLIDMSPTNQPLGVLCCTGDGSRAATTHSGEVIVWDLKAKQELCRLAVPRETQVQAAAFAPDGNEVVVAFGNKTVLRLAVEKK